MRTLFVALLVLVTVGPAVLAQTAAAKKPCYWNAFMAKLNVWTEVENKIDRFQKLLSDLRQAGQGRVGFIRGNVEQYQALRRQRDDLFDAVHDNSCLDG